MCDESLLHFGIVNLGHRPCVVNKAAVDCVDGQWDAQGDRRWKLAQDAPSGTPSGELNYILILWLFVFAYLFFYLSSRICFDYLYLSSYFPFE